MKLLFFLTLLSTTLFAGEPTRDLAHPFYLLAPGEVTLSPQIGYFIEEHEYEVAKVVQDLFEYRHLYYHIGSTFGLPGKRQFSIELSAVDHGDLDKSYSPALGLQNAHVTYEGFYAAEVSYQEHFEMESDKNKLALEIRFKGSPLKGKETNNTYQGKDIGFNLHYSHLHDDKWRSYGHIHTQIIGKKKMQKYSGEEEVVAAYSEFGTGFGLQYLQSKYWIDLNGIFYLTTDYTSKSTSYNRITDKGFVVGGRILFGYYLNQKTTVMVEHARKSSNFNVVTDDMAQEKEFEIETQSTQLEMTWLF